MPPATPQCGPGGCALIASSSSLDLLAPAQALPLPLPQRQRAPLQQGQGQLLGLQALEENLASLIQEAQGQAQGQGQAQAADSAGPLLSGTSLGQYGRGGAGPQDDLLDSMCPIGELWAAA